MSTSALRPLFLALLVQLPAALPTARPARPALDASDGDPQVSQAEPSTAREEQKELEDQPLETWRKDLLEVAIDVASSFPVDPHVKNRSRAQERVVEACLELGQPVRALAYVTKIVDWRRGAALADLADYCAARGASAEAERYLGMAREVAEGDEEGFKQEWRRDRIRAKIARALYRLGKDDEAATFSANLSASEVDIVEAALAAHLSEEDLGQRIEALDASLQGMVNTDLDLARALLSSVAEIYDRSYTDAERRVRIEKIIERIPWDSVPWAVQVEFEMELSRRALAHDDQATALAWALKAREAKRATHWVAEEEVALDADLARLRFEAGDTVRARRDLDAALASFDARREEIQSMFRAAPLRSIAEAYVAMGDTVQALTIYRNAVDEGAVNVNSRPRIDDLSQTCLSMAVHGVQPDERLWSRIREIESQILEAW